MCSGAEVGWRRRREWWSFERSRAGGVGGNGGGVEETLRRSAVLKQGRDGWAHTGAGGFGSEYQMISEQD
jgi:hypothetical protein